MSDFEAYMEDWSLQAIVRGSSSDFSKMMMDQEQVFDLTAMDDRHGFIAGFPEIFEVSVGLGDELEEFYKPFYPASNSLTEKRPQNVIEEDQKLAHDESGQSSESSGSAPAAMVTAPPDTAKYRRRKNQHKRVVIQVTADGLSSDMWAWRKYGQKPIKGSPYPRSYYRCSSSKGCLARKQVEQSCTDPGIFIVTYSAEHTHSQPTRRNSLAGTVRQKFPTTRNPNGYKTFKKEPSEESSIFPMIPTEAVLAEAARMIKEETFNTIVDEEHVKEESHGGEDHDFVLSELVINEDFFSGLEEFDDFNVKLPSCRDSGNKFPVTSRS